MLGRHCRQPALDSIPESFQNEDSEYETAERKTEKCPLRAGKHKTNYARNRNSKRSDALRRKWKFRRPNEKQRQKNPENLDKQQVRQMMNIGYVVFKNPFAAHYRRISIHMDEKINSERNYSRQLMQLSQEKSSADFYSHFSSLFSDFRFSIAVLLILNSNIKIGNLFISFYQ